ncbi:hypothetical protein K2173_022841 [Erythroxylum novogranatense]|uniref:Uncharacterized protein n=1 Tax=Erythroxylum novogranatense TaxID=1862640 RepID=A0AAV8SNX6_9ROSI|nr:hypothetical protein K2173_022841 [Erythroxylum novogranatense]
MEERSGYRKGLWTVEEDRILENYVKLHGKGKWNRLARETGLKRCGKSCRLRWVNYLSPSVKRGDFSEEEDDLIIRLHNLLGNRWSLIAGRVPGRTDNQVKNHWNTHLSKKLGVKKPKYKTVATSSRFSRELEPNFDTPSCSNPKPPPTCNEEIIGQNVVEDGASDENAVSLNELQELSMSDCFENLAFLFSYDDPNLYGLNSMKSQDS